MIGVLITTSDSLPFRRASAKHKQNCERAECRVNSPCCADQLLSPAVLPAPSSSADLSFYSTSSTDLPRGQHCAHSLGEPAAAPQNLENRALDDAPFEEEDPAYIAASSHRSRAQKHARTVISYLSVAKMVHADGHRLYLNALVRQERDLAYQRHDYLSHEWQMGLWMDEVKGTSTPVHPSSPDKVTTTPQRQSPSSVIMPPSSSPMLPVPIAPSEICSRWREKIIEWKYQVVDRFGKQALPMIICKFAASTSYVANISLHARRSQP